MSRPTDQLPLWRVRPAIAVAAAATIGLELALMRMLSLRFWSHFAYMVISVAILGFAASGTAMTLLRRHIDRAKRTWMFAAALGLAVSIPVCWLGGRAVSVDVQLAAWDLGQLAGAAALEVLMFVPFFFAGMFLGIPMMDSPGRISGHYAANLVGSAAGAIAAVAAMFVLTEAALAGVLATGVFCAALLLVPRRLPAVGATIAAGAAVALLCPQMLGPPIMSQYKMLPQVQLTPGSETVHQAWGPLGRIDVVQGPAIHVATGLALQYTGQVPSHVLLIVDGDQTSPVYDPRRLGDWAFADQTTAAVAYHLRRRPRVCVVGAGGGVDIGLALYHDSQRVTALEMNRQIIETMTGPLASRGGQVYRHPKVTVVMREGREYFAAAGEVFDVIQLPATDAFGASGAGLYATAESYLYTTEAFAAMWNRLSDRGLLAVTRWARTPPRDGLKVLDTAAQMFRSTGLDPADHLAMIRNWATTTVLISKHPLDERDSARIAAFCEDRGFDVCYLPGLGADQANRHHVLDRPYYFEGCKALLGADRREYLDQYPFALAAASDDRPYFFHFFRWRSLPVLSHQLGRRSRAFAEMGYLMLVAALIQAVLAGGVLVVLPLIPGIRALRSVPGRAASLGYFLAIGAGFMLLEMAFLQKLILYLGHPIYSAAVVIAGFLAFAGAGSLVSGHWPLAPRHVAMAAGAVVAAVAAVYLATADSWLGPSQSAAMGVRLLIAVATVAPLAFAMGHMLPAAMRQVSIPAGPIVPWAWAVNGFASVAATVAAPLLAMEIGFAKVILIAVACYLAAAGLAALLPKQIR